MTPSKESRSSTLTKKGDKLVFNSTDEASSDTGPSVNISTYDVQLPIILKWFQDMILWAPVVVNGVFQYRLTISNIILVQRIECKVALKTM